MSEQSELLDGVKAAVDYAIDFKTKLEGLHETIDAVGMEPETAETYKAYVKGGAQSAILAITQAHDAYTAHLAALKKKSEES